MGDSVSNAGKASPANLAEQYGEKEQSFAEWASGRGVIAHSKETQARVLQLAERLVAKDVFANVDEVVSLFCAADVLANAGMWLVVHMTYARLVHLDGDTLVAEDFKVKPEGHTGGSLNMVPAYVGYLLANALSGNTRSWLMGQGHCVAAIDSVNLLVGNMNPAHAERYDVSDPGLSRFVQDFYSYRVRPDGRPESPLGSHVNATTAGGIQEGGYLGFAELYYPHMPLPGEELVVFLSDGAFEEQRGSDWAPRWWRSQDSGAVIPIMIANGRRIDQRTTMSQQGGVDWFREHLKLNKFNPYEIDGTDPADFALSILEASEKLSRWENNARRSPQCYPFNLPYGIAETIKGFGFPGAGTNSSHNLPLVDSPASDENARALFNSGAAKLWTPATELRAAINLLNNHARTDRAKERDHPLAVLELKKVKCPEPSWKSLDEDAVAMSGVDDYFCKIVKENPSLRVRVGNPDELRSNRMGKTLELLQHRVTDPEPGVFEDTHGSVITALNEEAVICAALANKRGINLAVSYEAFAVKMLGALRQEIIFSRQQKELGQKPAWLSVPVIATSHTWENGKNEQSHQDPTLCEVLMNEMSDTSRVVFPADYNTAAALLRECYQTRGQIWTMVVPKREMPTMFSKEQALQLAKCGAVRVLGDDAAVIQIVAVGAYQLHEAMKSAERLNSCKFSTSVVYMSEPSRYRIPRDSFEQHHVVDNDTLQTLFPSTCEARLFLAHCRPETLLGVVRPLDTGPHSTQALGYLNRGGTLDLAGMLFANRCTWAHTIFTALELLDQNPIDVLSKDELSAVLGEGSPEVLCV